MVSLNPSCTHHASIQDIAEAPLPTVESALTDAKTAKALQSACKAAVKRGDFSPGSGAGNKRAATPSSAPSPSSKRTKGEAYLMGGPTEMTPQELERSLVLPLCMDEDRIAKTVLQTNRAPLLLAFAVELLRYTMPEQPLSSRLSLAQAVVGANSRSKAVSIGLEKGASADQEGWGEGQPRVKVLGREIAVLKRGGYEWKGEEEVGNSKDDETEAPAQADTPTQEASTQSQTQPTQSTVQLAPIFSQTQTRHPWIVSQPISLKNSTFVARAIHFTDPSKRAYLVQSLLAANPKLRNATHNAWAYRCAATGRLREDSFDDGETGCGDLMLRVMREVSAVDTLVVLTRWFGGIMLGPDRWRLMRNCVTNVLGERLRKSGHEIALGGEAVWGLDLEAARAKAAAASSGVYSGAPVSRHVVGMPIHAPEGARAYLLKSFGTAEVEAEGEGAGKSPAKKKMTFKAIEAEKAENLGLLLGALRIVFDSWADHLMPAELDRRAWAWYSAVRPAVDGGQSGWGAKGTLKLEDILKLRRGG